MFGFVESKHGSVVRTHVHNNQTTILNHYMLISNKSNIFELHKNNIIVTSATKHRLTAQICIHNSSGSLASGRVVATRASSAPNRQTDNDEMRCAQINLSSGCSENYYLLSSAVCLKSYR